jgi:hypothetical protein
MRRPGHNPTRRNRNIGTAAQGHGATNRFVIPAPWRDAREHWEKLGAAAILHKEVAGEDLTFLIEQTTRGFVHHCSVADVIRMLSLLPTEDWRGIAVVVFRQPTRKQTVLSGVWARLAYWGDFGVHASQRVAGPAVIIEATELRPWRMERQGTQLAAEIERLREDGHSVDERRNKVTLTPSAAAIRKTQLFRSLPHEVGHWVHWISSGGERHQEQYFRIPRAEREAYAHRYADRVRNELLSRGLLPFPPILDEELP